MLKFKVIAEIVIFEDVSLDGRTIDPGDEILEGACDEEGGIFDDLWPDTDMAMLDEFRCVGNGLGHVVALHDDRQATATEAAGRHLVHVVEVPFGGDEAEDVEFLEQL